MIRAVLVTPLPPQPTGLADYARRIISLTRGAVSWTVAYTQGGRPVPEAECVPVEELPDMPEEWTRVCQIGNSPHCEGVIRELLRKPAHALFHETNLHHVLRHMADESGDWSTYRKHVEAEYRDGAASVLRRMGKKARGLTEYDMRLRLNHLAGSLPGRATEIAVLSDTARMKMEELQPGRKIHRMGFLADFLERVQPPERSSDQIVIGIAGTYHYGRNWEAMSEAVAMLRSRYDCRLLVVGSGWPVTGQDWITVTGRLDDLEFRRALETIDVAVDLRHHTCSETSGSVMDLMRSGIPLVLSDHGSFRDLPADSVVRIPYSSGATGAAAALEHLLGDPEAMSAVGNNARKYFLQISDREACLAQWISFLERSGDED